MRKEDIKFYIKTCVFFRFQESTGNKVRANNSQEGKKSCNKNERTRQPDTANTRHPETKHDPKQQ